MNPTLGGGNNSAPKIEHTAGDTEVAIPTRGDLYVDNASARQSTASMASNLTGSTNWRHSEAHIQGAYNSNADDSAAVIPIQEAPTEGVDKAPQALNLGGVTYLSQERKGAGSRKWIIFLNIFLILGIIGLSINVALAASGGYDAAVDCGGINNNNSEADGEVGEDATEEEVETVNEGDPVVSSLMIDTICDSIDFALVVEIRQTIAENIVFEQEAGVGETAAILEGVDIPCLPKDAFALLDDNQLDLLLNSTSLTLEALGLLAIKADAFEHPDDINLFANIRSLVIIDNGLSDLPKDVFNNFPIVDTLDISGNAFVTLKEDLFGDGREMTEIRVSGNTGLVEFPTFFGFHPRIERIFVDESNALIKLVPDSLINTDCLELSMVGSERILEIVNGEEFLRILGFVEVLPELVTVG